MPFILPRRLPLRDGLDRPVQGALGPGAPTPPCSRPTFRSTGSGPDAATVERLPQPLVRPFLAEPGLSGDTHRQLEYGRQLRLLLSGRAPARGGGRLGRGREAAGPGGQAVVCRWLSGDGGPAGAGAGAELRPPTPDL
jgi:hypothetical protein